MIGGCRARASGDRGTLDNGVREAVAGSATPVDAMARRSRRSRCPECAENGRAGNQIAATLAGGLPVRRSAHAGRLGRDEFSSTSTVSPNGEDVRTAVRMVSI